MESPYYEMTHDFDEENRLYQSGYVKGYHDAVMRSQGIVSCKNCNKAEVLSDHVICCNDRNTETQTYPFDFFCADGRKRDA